ncbi:hypothetical protein BKA69DRAFT_1129752 [Paraphysoderma sedebokerense]|nr:hypothetical protein BKA69DRAFT_1129752 [Paraphysoderma sedebokerense]
MSSKLVLINDIPCLPIEILSSDEEEENAVEHFPEREQEFRDWLNAMSDSSLKTVLMECGLSGISDRRETKAQNIAACIHHQYRMPFYRYIISIDIGIKHFAWTTFDKKHELITDWNICNLNLESESPLATAEALKNESFNSDDSRVLSKRQMPSACREAATERIPNCRGASACFGPGFICYDSDRSRALSRYYH